MASESKGGEQRGLPYDTQCAGCEIPLYKGAENYVRVINPAGVVTFECDNRCGLMSAADRVELASISYRSHADQATGQAKYDETRGVMMSEADMEESIGGAVDYAAWGAAVPVTSASVEPSTLAPPADMAAEIERLRATSSAAAAVAAAEWTEKSDVFTAPCDIESWTPEDAHASYLGFSAASVPQTRSAAAPRRWLGEAAVSGGAAAEPPAMSSRQARILGGASEQN